MTNCFFVFELGMNLLLLGILSQKGASVDFNRSGIKILLGFKIIASGINKNRLSIFEAILLKEFVLLLKTAEAWYLKSDLARIKPDLARIKPDLASIKPDLASTKPDIVRNPDLVNIKKRSFVVYLKVVKTKLLNFEIKFKKARIVEIED